MILNSTKTKQRSTIPAAKREIYEFDLHGERIRFDADSLAVELVTGETAGGQRPEAGSRNGNGGRSAGVPPASPLPSGEGQGEGESNNPSPQSSPGGRGRVLPDGAIYWPRPERPNFRRAPNPGPVKKLVLNVTHDCNLACRYCFASVHERGQAMSAATARKAIEWAFGNAGASPAGPKAPSPSRNKDVAAGSRHDSRLGAGATINVSFFGGEPLMNWPVVLEAMRFAELLAANRGAKAKFHITTNASLLTAEMLGELKGRDCSFLVSIDGPQEIHDTWRPFRPASGLRSPASQSSHASAMAALERLKTHGMNHRVSARATYPLSDTRLVERLDYLYHLQRRGLIQGFSLEPAFMSEGCATDNGEIDWTAHAAEYHDAAVWHVGRREAGSRKPEAGTDGGRRPEAGGRNGNGKTDHPSPITYNPLPGYFYFNKIINRLRERKLTASECGAGCGYMTVGPDGTIYACHRETGTEIGHVDYGIDESKRAKWLDNRYYVRDGCSKCWARNICGGGCRQQSVSNGRPISQPTPDRCRLMRTLIKECLWIMAVTAERREAGRNDGTAEAGTETDHQSQITKPED